MWELAEWPWDMEFTPPIWMIELRKKRLTLAYQTKPTNNFKWISSQVFNLYNNNVGLDEVELLERQFLYTFKNIILRIKKISFTFSIEVNLSLQRILFVFCYIKQIKKIYILIQIILNNFKLRNKVPTCSFHFMLHIYIF